ncbi:protein grainyhead [Lepeophtheirus salmonis]|uniref:protein grainyhead n=1 Tax=Lepeophtheirus salmonis TaxID=72036 RepID=UPI003AF35BE3
MDFREQKSREEALKTWAFWHSRQHSDEIRILDVECNVVSGIVGPPTEIAFNAVSVQWSPDLGNAYIMIAVRCLSTDFSIQKGIKGIPLQLQIDTSDEFGTLISRAVCQVKVFCDKGAERKTREDLKRFVREIEKNSGPMEYCREGQSRSVFKPSGDLSSKPVLFNPLTNYQRLISGVSPPPPPPSVPDEFPTTAVTASSEPLSPKRRCIRYREVGSEPVRVMIYVRQDSEDIFTALHVHPPSVFGLIQAISAKYQIDFNNIRHLYRRDLRGIVVKVDDDMLKYYCDEDAFLMKVLAFEEKNTQSTVHDIVLVDLKTSLPDIRGGESHHSMSEKDTNNNNSSADNNNNESL